MSDAYLISGARTPIGKFLGSLSPLSAPELGAVAIRAALSRAGVAPGDVEDVIMGNILAAGVGQAPARQAALKAGLPPTVSALTINKVCGSGLQAAMLAAQAVRAGDARIVVAGGMESMSRAPFLLTNAREGLRLGNQTLIDSMIHDGLWCAFENCHMGSHADGTATKYEVSRADQDAFAAQSQARAAAAQQRGDFNDEIVPVSIRLRKEEKQIAADEGIRAETTLASLSQLRPAFDPQGTVTAGNASTLSDGAAAVVVTDAATAQKSNTPWKFKVVSYATSGVEPREIFIAPVAAVRMVLDKAGLKTSDIDLYEMNEAFSSQMVACARQLQLD
ncbi:MAG: acetyl-CoA C-acyltransferase, partial [Planctomycetaceae bacterium]|nr:acetyl-CoA C-acyltransferase [Planctomycetaceae bacterium]